MTDEDVTLMPENYLSPEAVLQDFPIGVSVFPGGEKWGSQNSMVSTIRYINDLTAEEYGYQQVAYLPKDGIGSSLAFVRDWPRGATEWGEWDDLQERMEEMKLEEAIKKFLHEYREREDGTFVKRSAELEGIRYYTHECEIQEVENSLGPEPNWSTLITAQEGRVAIKIPYQGVYARPHEKLTLTLKVEPR